MAYSKILDVIPLLKNIQDTEVRDTGPSTIATILFGAYFLHSTIIIIVLILLTEMMTFLGLFLAFIIYGLLVLTKFYLQFHFFILGKKMDAMEHILKLLFQKNNLITKF